MNHRNRKALIVIPLLLAMVACSPDQIQRTLNAIGALAQTGRNSWSVFYENLHTSGQVAPEAYARFLSTRSKVDAALHVFNTGVAAVKDKKGAVALITALLPVGEEFIASGLVIKNPQEQAKALAYATAFSASFSIAAAFFGSFTINVPPPTPAQAELMRPYEREAYRSMAVEVAVYDAGIAREIAEAGR